MVQTEKCTIVVVTRDRFSLTVSCLDALLQNTPEPCEILAVLGGAPVSIQKTLAARYDDKVRFIYGSRLLNPSESRNIGLTESKTRLAILMDNDVLVRPNWLSPLISCQNETGAAMIVPLVLDDEHSIHTAGNDLYITYKDGQSYGCKELRYGNHVFYDSCSLKRERTDYGELHCQLVDVEIARRLNVYDNKLREVAEVDSGLSWAKAGCAMWFEPSAVVHYKIPTRITRVEDIRPFLFKWDTAAIVESYDYFKKKWRMDIGDGGKWPRFLVMFNAKLGFLPRWFPSRAGLFLDECLCRARALVRGSGRLLGGLKARMLGSGQWVK
jgi:glycosyltransferase involved in cell wall biosynthesis